MKNTLLFLLLFLPFISKAQIEASLYADSERSSCEVSGIQNGTWDYDTIFVVGDVEVPVGNSLIVAEGTKVIFKDYFSIKVNGGFEAVGCEEDSIYFTKLLPNEKDTSHSATDIYSHGSHIMRKARRYS